MDIDFCDFTTLNPDQIETLARVLQALRSGDLSTALLILHGDAGHALPATLLRLLLDKLADLDMERMQEYERQAISQARRLGRDRHQRETAEAEAALQEAEITTELLLLLFSNRYASPEPDSQIDQWSI